MTQDLTEISRRAITLLGRVGHGPASVIKAELAPTREDFAAVFIGDAAQVAYDAYQGFWLEPPATLMRPTQLEVRVVCLPAQQIVESREFPGGYSKIAHLLVPDQLWCRFKFRGAGGNDVTAYDGLVMRGERWAWFPKPWRMLATSGAGEGN